MVPLVCAYRRIFHIFLNSFVGMPGWKNFAEPMLHSIDPTFDTTISQFNPPEGDVEFVGPRKILVPSTQVSRSLKSLNVLITSHPHPSLTKRLLNPILLPLWALASWHKNNETIENNYRRPAKDLLRILLQLSSNSPQPSSSNTLSTIVQNFMFQGNSTSSRSRWVYVQDSEGIQIQDHKVMTEMEPGIFLSSLSSIEDKASTFCALIQSIPEFDTEISHLFIQLCRKWLKDTDVNGPASIITVFKTMGPADSSQEGLIEAKLMQRLITSVPEKLVSDSRQVLDLINQILANFTSDDNEGNEDTVAIALSLLNIILTSPNSKTTPDSKQSFEEIQKSLYFIGKSSKTDISLTAQNLWSLVEFRDTLNNPSGTKSDMFKDRQYEDRKNYNLAMSYLTSADSPPPVRVQGLELISTLFQSRSSVLDIPALVVLFSSLLQDSDEYIYLRVIKSFIELSTRHPITILRDLIDRYVDTNEEAALDQRLRFGEALLQIIKKVGPLFSNDIARNVSEGLVSIAGRRGFRPKFQRERENEIRLKLQKDKEAERAWDGPPPQLDEYIPSEFPEDDEVLAQIVSGWESKRGSEDIRIRASALSILGSAIESNVAGIGSNLISMSIDLSIHILTLESEPENGILRRSAILLIMNFIKALDVAREQNTKLGFGLVGKSLDDVKRVLQFVEDTDNDGLVRQHARDVIDGLQTWQFNALLPSQNLQFGIQELAGLTVAPGGIAGSDDKKRPRIEEIE
jgi:hypothetical protein